MNPKAIPKSDAMAGPHSPSRSALLDAVRQKDTRMPCTITTIATEATSEQLQKDQNKQGMCAFLISAKDLSILLGTPLQAYQAKHRQVG